MGSYATGRIVFLARSLGTSQSVRSAALIGEGVSAPTDGVAVGDVKLTEFENLAFFLKTTFSYTGGASNPTLQVRLQRKFASDLADSDDAAWQDIAAFAAITGSVERFLQLELLRLTATNIASTEPEGALARDAIGAGNVQAGHPGEKIRVRETVSGGDRTGGTLTYNLRLLGIKTG